MVSSRFFFSTLVSVSIGSKPKKGRMEAATGGDSSLVSEFFLDEIKGDTFEKTDFRSRVSRRRLVVTLISLDGGKDGSRDRSGSILNVVSRCVVSGMLMLIVSNESSPFRLTTRMDVAETKFVDARQIMQMEAKADIFILACFGRRNLLEAVF